MATLRLMKEANPNDQLRLPTPTTASLRASASDSDLTPASRADFAALNAHSQVPAVQQLLNSAALQSHAVSGVLSGARDHQSDGESRKSHSSNIEAPVTSHVLVAVPVSDAQLSTQNLLDILLPNLRLANADLFASSLRTASPNRPLLASDVGLTLHDIIDSTTRQQ